MKKKLITISFAIGFTLLMFGCAGFDSNTLNASIVMLIGAGLMIPSKIFEKELGEVDEG